MKCETQEDEFSEILSELDTSKALMLRSRADLSVVLSECAHLTGLERCSPSFTVASRKMNQCAARYRSAVGLFNAACRALPKT